MVNLPVFILVLSCRAHRDTRQASIQETWADDLPPDWRILFIEGNIKGGDRIEGDHLFLKVEDDYNHLAEKTFRAVQFLLSQGEIQGILKCDDDTYLLPKRFERVFDRRTAYAGNTKDTLGFSISYAQGGAYWLNYQACLNLIAQPFESHSAASWYMGNTAMRKRGERRKRASVSIEDLMVGDILHKQGIEVTHDVRFNTDPFPSVHDDETLFTCHHVNPKTMRRIHLQRKWQQAPVKRLLVPFFRYFPASRKPR